MKYGKQIFPLRSAIKGNLYDDFNIDNHFILWDNKKALEKWSDTWR